MAFSHIEARLLQLTSSQSTLAPLQRVQNAAARLVFELGARDHVTASLIQLHWLPVHWRIQLKLCCIMHSVFMATVLYIWLTSYILVTAACSRSGLRSATSSNFALPQLRSRFGERSFSARWALGVERSAFRRSCCRGHESFQRSRQNSLF